jgi:SAM-dependent methyltransferase
MPPARTSAAVDNPEIFDRALRRLRRDRAARAGGEDILRRLIAEEIVDRLAAVQRPFRDVLDLGCGDGQLGRSLAAAGHDVTFLDAGAGFAAANGGVIADEDVLPFAPASFDLIVSAGVLDQVNDLPGALIQIRRALRPDGLFLAGFVAGGSLPALRRAMLAGDIAAGGATPRLHPQVDLRAAADLLQRAGFALPVADQIGFTLRYPHLFALVRDLRAMAGTSLLRDRAPLTRTALGIAAAAFADQADPDGKTPERFEIAMLTGWAPHESQPKPARRGSATASLAQVLGRGSNQDPA